MSLSDLTLWIGAGCALFSFSWLIGLVIGLRRRGVRLPFRFWFLHVAFALLVILGILLGLLLWKNP